MREGVIELWSEFNCKFRAALAGGGGTSPNSEYLGQILMKKADLGLKIFQI